MIKDVMITVSGMLFAGKGESEKDYIDVISPGQYYWKNDKHYLVYDEMAEGADLPIKNILQITPERVWLKKSGLITTEMVFDPRQETYSAYGTPFGVLDFAIRTERIRVTETKNVINAEIRYTLSIGEQEKTNNFIKILVQPRTPDGGFRL